MINKKIFVIGSYWAWNIWDEAILKSIQYNLWKDFDIIPAIPHLPYSIFRIPFRLRTIFNLWKSDVVLIWWWWLFTDSDTIKAIKIWWNCINWAKFFWKKIIVYANSIWSFGNNEAKNLAKKYLSKTDKITVRDAISRKEIESMWLFCEVFADPVFAFDYEDLKQISDAKIIAVSLRSYSFNHDLFNKYLKTKESEWFKILFISMTPEDSIIFEENYMQDNRTIVLPKDFDELLSILSRCEMCIWMRLHFLIASAILWKKMLAISYSNKVKWVMDNIWINCINLDCEDFWMIDELFKDPINVEREREKVGKLNEEFKGWIN